MEKVKEFGDLDTIRNKMGIMIAARLREQNKVKEAVKTQDRLSKKSSSWSGEKEIRKWREDH